MEMNPEIDLYLTEGCGRCPLGGTDQCKVHNWKDELKLLRKICLECGLSEELKWSVPCYTYPIKSSGKVSSKNILILSAFKDYAALSFFKGALLKDPEGMLIQQTENVQEVRQLRFTNTKQILEIEDHIKSFIFEAIENEKAGLKVELKKTSDFEMPVELQLKFDEFPELKKAFEALTPGRQRGYILHFSQAKQSATQLARIEKFIPKILEGKGFHDR